MEYAYPEQERKETLHPPKPPQQRKHAHFPFHPKIPLDPALFREPRKKKVHVRDREKRVDHPLPEPKSAVHRKKRGGPNSDGKRGKGKTLGRTQRGHLRPCPRAIGAVLRTTKKKGKNFPGHVGDRSPCRKALPPAPEKMLVPWEKKGGREKGRSPKEKKKRECLLRTPEKTPV